MSTALRAFLVVPIFLALLFFAGVAYAQDANTSANKFCKPDAEWDYQVKCGEPVYDAVGNLTGKTGGKDCRCEDNTSCDNGEIIIGRCVKAGVCHATTDCEGRAVKLSPEGEKVELKPGTVLSSPPVGAPQNTVPPSLSDTGDVSGVQLPSTNGSLLNQVFDKSSEQKNEFSPSASALGDFLKQSEAQQGFGDKIGEKFESLRNYLFPPQKELNNVVPLEGGQVPGKQISFEGQETPEAPYTAPSTFGQSQEPQTQTADASACDSWMSCMREKVSTLFDPSSLEEARARKLESNWNFGNMKSCSGGVCSGYQSFATPEEGAKADINNIAKWVDRGDDTLNKLMNRLSPSNDGNDTRGMVNYLSDKLGISPDTRLDLRNETQIVNLFNEKAFLEHSVRATDVMASRDIIGAYQSMAQTYGIVDDSQLGSQVPLPQPNPLPGGSFSYSPGEASGFDNLAAYNYFSGDNANAWAEVARNDNIASENATINSFAEGWEGNVAVSAQQNADANEISVFNDFAHGWEGNVAISSGQNETLVFNNALNNFAKGWEGNVAVSAEQNQTLADDAAVNSFAEGWERNAAISVQRNETLADQQAREAELERIIRSDQLAYDAAKMQEDLDAAARQQTLDDQKSAFEYRGKLADEQTAAYQKSLLEEAARNDIDNAANDAERRAALEEYEAQKAATEKAAEAESARRLEDARHAVDNAANDAERRDALAVYEAAEEAARQQDLNGKIALEETGNPYAGAESVQTYSVPTRYTYDLATGAYKADESSQKFVAISGTKDDANQQIAAYDKAIRWRAWNEASIAGSNVRLEEIRAGAEGRSAAEIPQIKKNIEYLEGQNAQIADASARFLAGDTSLRDQFKDIATAQENKSDFTKGLKEAGQDTTNWGETKSLWKKGEYVEAIASGFGNAVGELASVVSRDAAGALGAPQDPYFQAFCSDCRANERAGEIAITAANVGPFAGEVANIGKTAARVGGEIVADFATADTRIISGTVGREATLGSNLGDAGAAASRNAGELAAQAEREIAAARPPPVSEIAEKPRLELVVDNPRPKPVEPSPSIAEEIPERIAAGGELPVPLPETPTVRTADLRIVKEEPPVPPPAPEAAPVADQNLSALRKALAEDAALQERIAADAARQAENVPPTWAQNPNGLPTPGPAGSLTNKWAEVDAAIARKNVADAAPEQLVQRAALPDSVEGNITGALDQRPPLSPTVRRTESTAPIAETNPRPALPDSLQGEVGGTLDQRPPLSSTVRGSEPAPKAAEIPPPRVEPTPPEITPAPRAADITPAPEITPRSKPAELTSTPTDNPAVSDSVRSTSGLRNQIEPDVFAIENPDKTVSVAGSTRSGHGASANKNEDALESFVVRDGKGNQLSGSVLADGAGGGGGNPARASQVASQNVATELKALPANAPLADIRVAVNRGVENARATLASEGENGYTTLTAAVVKESPGKNPEVIVGQIGDSRAYLNGRDGSLVKMTTDQSTANSQMQRILDLAQSQDDLTRLARGSGIDPQLAQIAFDTRNQIRTAISASDRSVPEFTTAQLQSGDRVVLTSDGVHDTLSEQTIRGVLNAAKTPDEAANLLGGVARYSSGNNAARLEMTSGEFEASIGVKAEKLAEDLGVARESFRSKTDDISVAVIQTRTAEAAVPESQAVIASIAEKPWYQRAREAIFGKSETPPVAETPKAAVAPEVTPTPKAAPAAQEVVPLGEGAPPIARNFEIPKPAEAPSAAPKVEVRSNPTLADASINDLRGPAPKFDLQPAINAQKPVGPTVPRVAAVENPTLDGATTWFRSPWTTSGPILRPFSEWTKGGKTLMGGLVVGAVVVGSGITQPPKFLGIASPFGGGGGGGGPAPKKETGGDPMAGIVAPPDTRETVPPPPRTRRDDIPDNTTNTGDYCISSIQPVVVIPNVKPGPGCYNNPTRNSGWRPFPAMPPTPPASTPAQTATQPPVTTSPTSTPTAPPPVAKPYATLIANPSSVAAGGKSRLIWSSVNTSSCELFAPDNYLLATGTRGSTSTPPLATTTPFTLQCSAPTGATITASTTVTVR